MEIDFRQGRVLDLPLVTAAVTSWHKQSHTTKECREFHEICRANSSNSTILQNTQKYYKNGSQREKIGKHKNNIITRNTEKRTLQHNLILNKCNVRGHAETHKSAVK